MKKHRRRIFTKYHVISFITVLAIYMGLVVINYFALKKNGEDFDSERYRKFYSFLISANAEELVLDEVKVPEGEPMAEVSFTDAYDNKKYTYQFYDDSMMKVLVTVNGEPRYYSSKAFVNTLMGNIKKLDTSEEFVTTW